MSGPEGLPGNVTLAEANAAVSKLREDLLKAVDLILFNFMDSTSVPLENVFLGVAVQMWPNNLLAETRLSAPMLVSFRCVGGQTIDVPDANGVEFGRFVRANIEHSTLYGAVLQGLTRPPESPKDAPTDNDEGEGAPERPESA